MRRPVARIDLLVLGRPPDLVIRGGDHLPDQGARHGAPDSRVQVRRQPLLRLDRGEVLHRPPAGAAEVLPEPVDQGAKVDRIARRPPVVVGARVDRRPIRAHRAVGGHGQGGEGRRSVDFAVRGRERPPERRRAHGDVRAGRVTSWRRRVERTRRGTDGARTMAGTAVRPTGASRHGPGPSAPPGCARRTAGRPGHGWCRSGRRWPSSGRSVCRCAARPTVACTRRAPRPRW